MFFNIVRNDKNMYVVVDKEAKAAQILSDSTQVAQILGVSARTIQRWMVKTYVEKEKYDIYRVDEGVKKSNRGNNKGYVLFNGVRSDNF